MLMRLFRAVSYRLCSWIPACRQARANPLLRSAVHELRIPLPPDKKAGWKSYGQFRGRTRNRITLSCHASVLTSGNCPHPPHRHDEEEILVLLAGQADLNLPEWNGTGGDHRLRLSPGQFVYYPAQFPHTLESVGDDPANYLMVKWSSRRPPSAGTLQFGHYEITVPEKRRRTRNGFHGSRLFEGPTRHLDKLHCHATTLEPRGGYAEHADAHDVVIVMLAGECETLGRRFRANDVIYYAAGEPHGMRNPGPEDAHYLVFEFHGGYGTSPWPRVSARLRGAAP